MQGARVTVNGAAGWGVLFFFFFLTACDWDWRTDCALGLKAACSKIEQKYYQPKDAAKP